jgi:hypothetical protein
MKTHSDKTKENESQAIANTVSQSKSSGNPVFQFVDNRPEAIEQKNIQEMVNNSSQTMQLSAFQEMADNSSRAAQAAQLQALADNNATQQKQPVQKKENNTGLPDNLKTGIENLSGYAMDDVKVHYNSDKPAQVQAHAYAQGTEIHVASGQEKHLPHEAWHIVQQKQGRVQPTMQMKGNTLINDDAGLEKEADVMGANALANNSVEKHNDEVVQGNSVTQLHLMANGVDKATIQRTKVGAKPNQVDVYVDNGGYPIWKQDGEIWHLTMKDDTRWHITKGDRSMSYWFNVDAGTVTSVEPKKAEFGGHREKHSSLSKAPDKVKKFVTNYISDIIKVTEAEPDDF